MGGGGLGGCRPRKINDGREGGTNTSYHENPAHVATGSTRPGRGKFTRNTGGGLRFEKRKRAKNDGKKE